MSFGFPQLFEALQKLGGGEEGEHLELLARLASAYGRSREQGAVVRSMTDVKTLMEYALRESGLQPCLLRNPRCIGL